MQQEDQLKTIVSHARKYGFVFPGSEVYDGLHAVYDYGPYGVELRNNIKQYWWKSMTQMHENIVGIDSAIFMHPTVWKASGHTDAFNDPMIDNKDSKKRYRADVLIENHCAGLETRAGEEIIKRMTRLLEAEDLAGLKGLIEELGITDPVSGSGNWTDVRQFNLMFETEMGPTADGSGKVYLRPETAQGIFVNFLNVQKSARMKVPFGIAQIGKAFRNEIIARQFIFRMREFEQMEMQFFVRPGEEMKWYAYWKEARMKWHRDLGISEDRYRFRDHGKLAHYANAAVDIEFHFPMGFRELEGIHSRTDFDLRNHEEYSGRKLQYFDPELGKSYIPYVVETSIGLDRMFLAILSHSYNEEQLAGGSVRTVLNIPPILAPIKVAVLPLVKKDGLSEKAREVMDRLKFRFPCQYDEKDAIGKRYRRQDAIGTPYCVTVDHDTLNDHQVTIRERDSMKQQRVPVEQLTGTLCDQLNWSRILAS